MTQQDWKALYEARVQGAGFATEAAKTYQSTGKSKVTLYVLAILILSVSGLGFVMALTLMGDPTKDNSLIITTGLTGIGATITALLGLTLKEVSSQVDGRLTELLEMTKRENLAKGKLAGPDPTPPP